MYAWIWRKLPFGVYGKLSGSILLAVAVGSLLWFVVFPWAGPHISPLESDPGTGYNEPGPGGNGNGVGPSPSFNPNDHEIPYETSDPAKSPSPSPSKKRR